jgi:hypothetical protein
MAIVTGYALQDMEGNELQRMQMIPNPLFLPNGDYVYGAVPGWSNDAYHLVEISWDVPDPPPPPPPPTPPVSKRQFFQQLAIMGQITEQEALDAITTGQIPAKMATVIASLPVDQQFGAKMALVGSPVFDRNNPLVPVMQQGLGWTDAQTDDLWRAAALLS